MTMNDKVRDEKLQYNIKREASKISHFHQVKYEYPCEEILPSNQRLIEIIEDNRTS